MNLNEEIDDLIKDYHIQPSLEVKFKASVKNVMLNCVAELVEVKQKEDHFNKIVSIVADVFNYKYSDLFLVSRSRHLVSARQMAQYILTKNNFQLTYIANRFKQDHSTVINSRDKMDILISQNLYGFEVAEIKKRLVSRFNTPLFIDQGTPAPADCEL